MRLASGSQGDRRVQFRKARHGVRKGPSGQAPLGGEVGSWCQPQTTMAASLAISTGNWGVWARATPLPAGPVPRFQTRGSRRDRLVRRQERPQTDTVFPERPGQEKPFGK